MAILNFDAELMNIDGTPIKDGDKPLTLKGMISVWLYTNYADEAELSGDEKFERAKLAFKLDKGGDQDFCKDEISLMSRVVGKRGAIAVVFQFRNYLAEADKLS